MTLIDEYKNLLGEIDRWFSRCQEQHFAEITCRSGCSECCRGLFDITILDAALLQSGFAQLPAAVKAAVLKKAEGVLQAIRSSWLEFKQPYILNYRPDEEQEKLLASDNDTPCVLLDPAGRCLLYTYRPMTCRLHGLPLIDVSGRVMESEWCTKNFPGVDPLQLTGLRGEFERLLQLEAELGRAFTGELLGVALNELDTVIPTALLFDVTEVDWRRWREENPF